MTKSKPELRSQLLQQRKLVTKQQQQRSASIVCETIGKLSCFQVATKIAFYFPAGMELDPLPTMQVALAQQKVCYLPAISGSATNKQLLFIQCDVTTQLSPNKFNILEPAKHEPVIALPMLDLIFLPLVGFDLHGNRLGMGAGYYDATLASLGNMHPKTKILGLAYAFQQVDQIPNDPWDITMDGIVTDTGFMDLQTSQKSHSI